MVAEIAHDEARASKPRVATCVVGAMRTFTDPIIQESMVRNLARYDGSDVFLYLFVGEELSSRGQSGAESSLSPRNVKELLNLTTHKSGIRPAATRIQTVENGFRCDQMSTGRFYKIS